MICECGNETYIANQVFRAEVIVDGEGAFLGDCEHGLNIAIYDAENPYGPFICTKCWKQYDDLT